MSSLTRRNKRLGIGRRDHDCVHTLSDHLVDQADLTAQVALVLDAVDDQLEIAGVLALVPPGALGHRGKELVGERLHDQCDPRLR